MTSALTSRCRDLGLHSGPRRVAVVVRCVATTLALSSGPVEAAVLYVAPGGNDAGTCTTPGAPCLTSQAAVDKANAGDTVRVATGVYSAPVAATVVTVGKDLTLAGGWNTAFTLQAGLSTIDGLGVSRGVAVDSGITAGVSRFLIRGGYTDAQGGGIFNQGTLTLDHLSVRGNAAYGVGGGIYSSGTLTVRDSAVLDNSCTQIAGGVYSFGVLTAENTTIARNRGAVGGGLLKEGSSGSVSLSNVTIADNIALT